MGEIIEIGADWLAAEVDEITDAIKHVSPVEFNEANRYLPASVTSQPGYIRFDVNPPMVEILECIDVDSPVREVNLKKGVQITFSTLLESMFFYAAAHVKTLPMMYMTADKELAESRIENNFLPMFNESDFGHIIKSSDDGNSRKTGKTKKQLQFDGGAVLYPFGGRNANKMRNYSIWFMAKDELDAWPHEVGEDGCPDKTSDARCSGYWLTRKIFRGSTPLIKGTSKIQKQYLRGDQREYLVLCKACGFPQKLRWSTINKNNGIIGGFQWDLEDGMLILDSVCYCCRECGHQHYEKDKERLLSLSHGAHWRPTARPVEPFIRSYHLPAMYSPIGMQPWSKSVGDYLEAWDVEEKRVKDPAKYQVFYNNILAEPYEIRGAKIKFEAVSAHRRQVYKMGEVPNAYAEKHSGSKILFTTCQVDVHKRFLAVAVMGWTRDAGAYLIDYFKFETVGELDTCEELSGTPWSKLRDFIEEKKYTASDGWSYNVYHTWIDAGYSNDTVVKFCAEYAGGVSAVLGRDRSAKNQAIKEFSEFTTQSQTIGYKILVDHYKDRLAPVLRREWREESGPQKPYHFNAPVDTTDDQLRELTRETRRKKTDENGRVSYFWHRPSGARNELWDLLVYGHAGVEIIAWNLCIKTFELETIDWPKFWDYMENEKKLSQS